MDANAIGRLLADRFGKHWYIITPAYAYGWSLQESFTKVAERRGGKVLGADRLPLGTGDYSAVLLIAARAKPDVLLVFQAGDDAVAILKQIGQFGLDKQMAIAGGLQEWENIVALQLDRVNAFYGKSHILHSVSLQASQVPFLPSKSTSPNPASSIGPRLEPW